jgi:hypothetical protein
VQDEEASKRAGTRVTKRVKRPIMSHTMRQAVQALYGGPTKMDFAGACHPLACRYNCLSAATSEPTPSPPPPRPPSPPPPRADVERLFAEGAEHVLIQNAAATPSAAMAMGLGGSLTGGGGGGVREGSGPGGTGAPGAVARAATPGGRAAASLRSASIVSVGTTAVAAAAGVVRPAEPVVLPTEHLRLAHVTVDCSMALLSHARTGGAANEVRPFKPPSREERRVRAQG